MNSSQWTVEKVLHLTQHFAVVWVEDSFSLIEEREMESLRKTAQPLGYEIIQVNNAFDLRVSLEGKQVNTSKLIVIDQSYFLRNPHQLPKDAKPSDLRPIPAPDWKAFVNTEAIFRPTVREFLISVTGNDSWPPEVDIFPYEKLARDNPEAFIQSFQSFVDSGKPLTTNDLRIIGASAVFGRNLFEIHDPFTSLEIAFHMKTEWETLAMYFNKVECEWIKTKLAETPNPYGNLFGSNSESARLALISLVVLKQHTEEPGVLLPIISETLKDFQECQIGMFQNPPTWFISDEVPLFEAILDSRLCSYFIKYFQLSDTENAQRFARAEGFSGKLRGLVPFEVQGDASSNKKTENDFAIERLIPQFQQEKRELEKLLGSLKGQIDRLTFRPFKELNISSFIDIFSEKGFFRIDGLVGRIQALTKDIEGPARREWQSIPDFSQRWEREVEGARKMIESASTLQKNLDFHFGRFLEAMLAEKKSCGTLSIDQIYEKWIFPRRRSTAGKLQKAVIVVVDSMRLDLWHELVKPALEKEYSIEESVAIARLPTVTHVSRKSFFTGKPPQPSDIVSRSEMECFGELLSRSHAQKTSFEVKSGSRPGISYEATSTDSFTKVFVFDFTDRLSHEVNWDPHMVQEALKPLLKELRAILAEIDAKTPVFITADHGHLRMTYGSPIFIEETQDVGYRSASTLRKIEGSQAAHLFQIPAVNLGLAEKGWYVFPKPGFYLRGQDRGKGKATAGYRHGGMSLFEVLIPVAILKHKKAATQIRLSANAKTPFQVGLKGVIEVSLSCDGKLASPVRLESSISEFSGAILYDICSTPKTVEVSFLPKSPGSQVVSIRGLLAEDIVGEISLTIQVQPGPEEIDPAVAKLKKMFGDDS